LGSPGVRTCQSMMAYIPWFVASLTMLVIWLVLPAMSLM